MYYIINRQIHRMLLFYIYKYRPKYLIVVYIHFTFWLKSVDDGGSKIMTIRYYIWIIVVLLSNQLTLRNENARYKKQIID